VGTRLGPKCRSGAGERGKREHGRCVEKASTRPRLLSSATRPLWRWQSAPALWQRVLWNFSWRRQRCRIYIFLLFTAHFHHPLFIIFSSSCVMTSPLSTCFSFFNWLEQTSGEYETRPLFFNESIEWTFLSEIKMYLDLLLTYKPIFLSFSYFHHIDCQKRGKEMSLFRYFFYQILTLKVSQLLKPWHPVSNWNEKEKFSVGILFEQYIILKVSIWRKCMELHYTTCWFINNILFLQVVDMALALEAVSLLERTTVTKEALEVRVATFKVTLPS